MNDKEQKELSQNLRELDQNELKHFLDYVNEGNIIRAGSPEMEFSGKMLQRAMVIMGSLNTGFCAPDKVSMIMNELTNGGFDPTASVVLPFSTDFGCNIHVEKGVFINAVVAAGAVVREDVPENTVVGGVPARVLKKI